MKIVYSAADIVSNETVMTEAINSVCEVGEEVSVKPSPIPVELMGDGKTRIRPYAGGSVCLSILLVGKTVYWTCGWARSGPVRLF